MNNDAFQKLVRERSNVKSSKEIAREAVQEEFRNRRGRQQQQRRGGGGGGSHDDDDVGSSDEEGGGRRQHKQQDSNKRSKNRNDNEDDAKQKDEKEDNAYRDRAKERRETSGIAHPQNKEAGAVVLVKGLDLSLARSLKKQPFVKGTSNSGKEEQVASFVQNSQEAIEFILSSGSSSTAVAPTIKSELGKEMLEYLRSTFLKENTNSSEKMIAVTPAGMAIQQSVLTFSIHANPGDTARAWEVPREQTYASIDCRRLYEKASPVCCNSNNSRLVLESMERALERNNNKNNTNARHRQPQSKAATEKKNKQSQDTDYGDDDDDGDDIFGDVGEYDPLSKLNPGRSHDNKTAVDDRMARPKVDKGSLFEQDRSKQQEEIAASTSVSETGVEQGQDTAPTSTRLVGLSSSSFNAAGGTGVGYGDDDMDVDFDGRIQDEEEEEAEGNKKKKKKKRKRKKGSGSDED